MKKNNLFVTIVLLIIVISTVLNLLYISEIVNFRWIQIGGYAILLSILSNMIIYRGKRGPSPFYWKNWKQKPLTAVLFLGSYSAFVITLAIALYSRV